MTLMNLQKNYKKSRNLKLLNNLFFLISYLFSTFSYAEGTITPLKKGDIAPHNGVLLNAEAVAEIKVNMTNAKYECDLFTKKQLQTQEIEYKYQLETSENKNKRLEQETKVMLENAVKEKDVLLTKLKDEENMSGYKNYILPTLGFVGGVGLTLAVVFIVNSTTK